MAKLLKEFGKKKTCADQSECRVLHVNMPAWTSVDVEFTNITMQVSRGFIKKKNKTILKSVSGLFKSGQLTAIMGPSGAGKSSLMNALTGFSTSGVTGTIRGGDSTCELSSASSSTSSLKAYRQKTCYILQDDRLNPLFTVQEVMKFAADVKLGNILDDTLKRTVIAEVLHTLGLTGSENTRCGKLSGGQKKRVSIAMELIDNPPVVFLDEPTTGLDSLTSVQCMMLLKNLARDGRTIVCTIHQPPASLYSMFDQVYILAEGMCIYNGPSENTVPYLASFGLQCPKYHNPADYILEIATGEYGKFNEMLAEKCSRPESRAVKSAAPLAVDAATLKNNKISIIVRKPHEMHKLGILFKRCILQQYRDWTTTHLKVLLHIVIGVLLGLLYERAGTDPSKTVSNLGFLLVSAAYLCYTSIMPAVLKFPLELSVLKKENFNNWYDLKTYYLATLVTGIPLQIVYSFIYAVPSYFLSGQPQEFERFVMFVLVLALVSLIADAIGNVIGTCVNQINGTFLGAITTCTMLVFCGFLVLFSHMSAVMRALSHLSFLRYVFEAEVLALYAFGRQPLDCPDTNTYCHMRYPREVIKEFGLNYNNFWLNVGILVAEIVIFRIIAYWTLRRYVKKSS